MTNCCCHTASLVISRSSNCLWLVVQVRDRLVHDAQRGINKNTEEIKYTAQQHKSRVQTIQAKLIRAASRSDRHTRAADVSSALQVWQPFVTCTKLTCRQEF